MTEEAKEKAAGGISVEIIPKPPYELEIEIGHWLLDGKVSVIVELVEVETGYDEGADGRGEVQKKYRLHVSREIEKGRFVHVLCDAAALIYARSGKKDALNEAAGILEMLTEKLV